MRVLPPPDFTKRINACRICYENVATYALVLSLHHCLILSVLCFAFTGRFIVTFPHFAAEMQSFLQGFQIFFCLTLGLSASLPPSLSLLRPSITALSNSTDPAVSLNGTVVTLPYIQPFCSMSRAHGFDMSEASCRNAWQKIDRSTNTQFFRPRRHNAGLVTPIRFLSDDGICAIDVELKPSAIGDTSTWFIISSYAEVILDECVAREKGGAIHDFSKSVSAKCKTPNLTPIQCIYLFRQDPCPELTVP